MRRSRIRCESDSSSARCLRRPARSRNSRPTDAVAGRTDRTRRRLFRRRDRSRPPGRRRRCRCRGVKEPTSGRATERSPSAGDSADDTPEGRPWGSWGADLRAGRICAQYTIIFLRSPLRSTATLSLSVSLTFDAPELGADRALSNPSRRSVGRLATEDRRLRCVVVFVDLVPTLVTRLARLEVSHCNLL